MDAILEVHDLHVAYCSRAGIMRPALEGVSFAVRPGEILGVLGESGSGKSTLAATLLRLLPANGVIKKGSVFFGGRDLLQIDPGELPRIRGARISLIFQEPAVALHPTMRVGVQVMEVLHAHTSLGTRARREKAQQTLASVFASDVDRIFSSYPHQLSGGQRQRVLIAQAIVCGASLVVADEPTASLDPTTQSEILLLFQKLRQQLGLTLILITHNPALLAGLADRVLVLYAGKVAEVGPAAVVLSSPQHPYTCALLRCMPVLYQAGEAPPKNRLPVIPGDSPNLSSPVQGCRFAPRCPDRMEACAKREPLSVNLSEGHNVSCFKYGGL